jgi:hypothetical protein
MRVPGRTASLAPVVAYDRATIHSPRKQGHPKHAVFYLAGTPRSSAEADDAATNASLISSITA